MTRTRDEVLALKSGRELDTLVAEKVMGWEYFPAQATGMFVRLGYFFDPVSGEAHHHWSPSTDIAAAFEVWEHDRPEDWIMTINWTDGQYTAKIMTVNEDGLKYVAKIEADTAAEAMVKCRLLAVGDD